MQKDAHFYLTYALARKVGIADEAAERIAWADQFTDELTEGDIHGIQTQSALLGNWGYPQIQMSVLVPFHFVPGDDPGHLWKTTADSRNANALVDAAATSGNELRLGIALHACQDTFSHQGFSGWREELNSCYPWYAPISSLPNVGHAEMQATPDIISAVWTDPRTDQRIDNRARAMLAAAGTYRRLESWHRPTLPLAKWEDLEPQLKRIFDVDPYDRRKDELARWSGAPQTTYSKLAIDLMAKAKEEFIAAAAAHLAKAIELFPWAVPAAKVAPVSTRAGALLPVQTVPLSVELSSTTFSQSLRVTVKGAPQPPQVEVLDRYGRQVLRLEGAQPAWTPDADTLPGLYRVAVTIGDKRYQKAVFYER
jgi:hypothetical protein